MIKNSESKKPRTTDQLLEEADELIQNINNDAIKFCKEKHSLRQEQIKSRVNCASAKKRKPKGNSRAEGMHEAILDIAKAVRAWKNKLF